MSQKLAFVITDGSGRIGSSDRQLIRRHCMRQKNKQPGSRRSKREAARAAAQPSHEPRLEKQEIDNPSDRISVRNRVAPPPAQVQLFVERCILPPPSDWALFHFPEGLDISAQKSMHQCSWCSLNDEEKTMLIKLQTLFTIQSETPSTRSSTLAFTLTSTRTLLCAFDYSALSPCALEQSYY